MRVGFDVGPITATRTGVGNYCFYLLKHLLQIAPEVPFKGFSTGTGPVVLNGLGGRLQHRHLPVPTRAMYAVWNSIGRPYVDRLLGDVDVYHATNYFLPPTRSARRVVTIHDLAFLTVPEYCSPKIVGPFSKRIGDFARRADAIMTYSKSTKADVMNHLDVPADKITVAPMAVDEGFKPMPRDAAERHLAGQYNVRTPFLLFVSTLEPRKNVVGLLRAFAELVDDIPHNLVLIGSAGWSADTVFDTISELKLESRVIRPGFVPHMELPAFYCAADAFVFPTHYEGFGLPLLEALTCGCPVVSAANSSVPEVTGDAALLVDPNDPTAIADAVRQILDDHNLRDELIARGREHARTFSWNACAEATLRAYRRVTAS